MNFDLRALTRRELGSRFAPLAAAIFATGVLLSLASPAHAQLNVPPPAVIKSSDRNGVDLVHLTITRNLGSVSVGPTQGGLSDSLTRTDGGTEGPNIGNVRHSLVGGVAEWHAIHPFILRRFTVTVLGETNVFLRTTSGTYVFKEGKGGTLVEGGGASFTYTAPDGTVATFSTAVKSYSTEDTVANTAGITSIRRLNGEIITYNYNGTTDSTRVLQSVTNNYGYMIHFDYTPSTGMKVEAINNAVDPCAPLATTCTSLTQAWPTLTLSGGVWTNSLGQARSSSPTGTLWPAAGGGGPAVTTQLVTENGGATFNFAVQTVSDNAGTWTYTFQDPDNVNPDEITTNTGTDPLGHVTTVEVRWYEDHNYDDPVKKGKLLSITDPLGNKTTYGIDQRGRLTAITNPEGDKQNWTYTALGLLTGWTHTPKTGSPLSAVSITATYPSSPCGVVCGLPVTVTDQRSNVTNYTYDTAGNLLTATSPAPTSGAVRPQTRYAWQQRNAWYKQGFGSSITQNTNPIWVQIEQSQCATMTGQVGTTPALCDGLADEILTTPTYQVGSSSLASNILPLMVSSGAGNGSLTATTTTTYDGVSNVLTVNGPLSGTADTTRYVYDAIRQQVGVIGPDPDGAGSRLFPATKTTFNADGQVTATAQGTTTGQTDTNWAAFSALQTATTTYDAQGRKTKDVMASGTANSTVVQYSYDAASRMTCSVRRMNPAVFGSLPTSACALGTEGAFGKDRITFDTYDTADRLLSTVDGYLSGAPITESQTWTPNSQTLTRTDGAGNVSTYVYDGFDRISRLRFPNASGGGTSTTDYEEYTYDAADNPLTKRTRGGLTFTTTFDALSRIILVDAPSPTQDSKFTYDNLNRRLTACWWSGTACSQTITAVWDALGRQTLEAGAIGTVGYGYDLAGRRTSITWPDAIRANYDYDLSNQVTAIKEGTTTLTTLATYTYDNLAMRTAIARPTNTLATSYGYDTAARLNALTQNLNGSVTTNDVTFGFTRNPASQLITRTVSNAAYNFTPVTASTAYVNNGRNQVTSAGGATITYDVTTGSLSNGNIANDGTTAYTYDAANRLLTAGTRTYAYDPLDRLYQENATASRRFLYAGTQLIGEYNTSNVIQNRYVPGPGVDEPLAEYAGAAVTTPIFYAADERGSIIARATATGLVGSTNTYDAYGVPSSTVTGRFQYTGQTRLSDSELYYYKARIYAPTLGRFLQTDSVGYEAGLNLYAYVTNDPVNGTDPTGKCGVFVAQCVGAAIGAGIELTVQLTDSETRSDYAAAGQALARGDLGEAWSAAGSHVTDVGIAGVAGAIGGGVGGAVESTLGKTVVRRSAAVLGDVAGGATAGGTQAGLQGENIAVGAVIGGAVGGTARALRAGTAAQITPRGTPRTTGNPVQIMPGVGGAARGATTGVAAGVQHTYETGMEWLKSKFE